jgi:phage FluMu gp28-like protein
VCIKLLELLPVDRFLVDDMGIGMYLAEKLEGLYPTVVEGVSFTNESKQDMAVLVKVRMQKLQTPLPLERDLSYQIHSIKRTVTPSKRLVFDTAANEKHHADKFWAFALAQTATEEAFDFGVQQRNPLSGYRG